MSRPISSKQALRQVAVRYRRRAPSAARYKACARLSIRRTPVSSFPAASSSTSARQEAGQRLARAGGRDQQRRFPGFGLREQFELMRARLPAFRRKPVEKGFWQVDAGGRRLGRRRRDAHAGKLEPALFSAKGKCSRFLPVCSSRRDPNGYLVPMRFEDLLRPTPKGLYCPPGDFYIDPVRPVERALVTHGHADHARPGHAHVMATRETLDIMGIRYGERLSPARRSRHLMARCWRSTASR
jgi:hypothetical protein